MTKWIIILLLLITNHVFGQNKCIGERLMLWVDSNANWSYKWVVEPNMAFIGQSTPIITIDSIKGDMSIYVEVVNSSGCVGEAYLYLPVDDCGWTIYFPNALVPDGTNTTWFPKYTNVVIKELTIWDRWGHVQWSWNGSDEFLGLNNKGTEMPSYVYTFLCIYSPINKGVEYRKIGKVVIIR